MLKHKQLLIIALIKICLSGQQYQKVIHNIDPQAKCIDGSPGLLYIHQGNEKDKFLIHFEGGGFCAGMNIAETIDFCYNRSKTHLGSSKYWPQQKQYDGYLSTDASNEFASWTKIVFGYCDGAFHQGYREAPISYKNSLLYFRGAAITRSHFKWMVQTLNLDEASKVILTGQSAGGVASYLWSNYLSQNILKDPSVLYTVPDSAGFVAFKAYQIDKDLLSTAIQNMYQLSNINQPNPMKQCNQYLKGKQWQCMYLINSFAQIQAPMLLINSEYDSWAIANTLQIKCITKGVSGYTIANCSTSQKQYIEQYRTQYLSLRNDYLLFGKNSLWSIGCSHHGYAYDDQFYDNQLQKVPGQTGYTVKQALLAFLDGKRVIQTQMYPWPANKPCAY